MTSLRLWARQAAGEIPYLAGLRRPAPGTLCVLMYHAVTRENLRDPEQQTVPLQRFSDQMEAVRELGVRWVSLEEGLRLIKEGGRPAPMASVVFDDGYVGVHDLALEVLVRHRIPATLFLATELIGRPSFPDNPPGWGRPLNWEEVAALTREAGCAVGSHGHHHRVLTPLSSEQIREELKTSRRILQDHLGKPCRLFAYPYGAGGTFDARTRRILNEEGFTAGCTTLWGRCGPDTDPLALPRMRVSWCDTPREMRKSAAGCYDGYAFFQRFRL